MSHPVVQAELKRLPADYWQVVDDRVKIAYLKELKSIAGVVEVLETLALPKCVASSSEPDWLAFKLEHTKLEHHFPEAIFSGSMVKRSKPAPAAAELSRVLLKATERIIHLFRLELTQA